MTLILVVIIGIIIGGFSGWFLSNLFGKRELAQQDIEIIDLRALLDKKKIELNSTKIRNNRLERQIVKYQMIIRLKEDQIEKERKIKEAKGSAINNLLDDAFGGMSDNSASSATSDINSD